jgi:hypothetical protein
VQFSRPVLTAAKQLLHLRKSEIARGDGDVRGGDLTWLFEASPTPLSRNYRVCIKLTQGQSPRIVIEDPNLVELAGGRKLPHVYGEAPVSLCLYHPQRREWTPADRLDLTVVPWIYLWLFFFEEWLTSDDWKGGGEHPEPGVTVEHFSALPRSSAGSGLGQPPRRLSMKR